MRHEAGERPFRIPLTQMAMSADPAANLDRAATKVEEAARAGACVVCLPELFRARYFCQSEDHASFALAEPIPGPSTERLTALARRLEVVIVAPMFERRAPGVYHNSAVILDADGKVAGARFTAHRRTLEAGDRPRRYRNS